MFWIGFLVGFVSAIVVAIILIMLFIGSGGWMGRQPNYALYTVYMVRCYGTYEWGGFLKILCITLKCMVSCVNKN